MPIPPAKSAKAVLRLKLYIALVAADLFALVIGFTGAIFFRYGGFVVLPGVELTLAIAPVFFGLAFSGQAYSLDALQAPKTGVLRALWALILTCLVLLAVFFNLKISSDMSRIVFGTGALASGILIVIVRYSVGIFAGHATNWNFLEEVLLVDGVTAFPTRGQIVIIADQAGLSPGLNGLGGLSCGPQELSMKPQ